VDEDLPEGEALPEPTEQPLHPPSPRKEIDQQERDTGSVSLRERHDFTTGGCRVGA
jgi:hypothetical protein